MRIKDNWYKQMKRDVLCIGPLHCCLPSTHNVAELFQQTTKRSSMPHVILKPYHMMTGFQACARNSHSHLPFLWTAVFIRSSTLWHYIPLSAPEVSNSRRGRRQTQTRAFHTECFFSAEVPFLRSQIRCPTAVVSNEKTSEAFCLFCLLFLMLLTC